jgi:hypothetical protein
MSESYKRFMNDIRKKLTITLYPSTEQYQAARAEYEALTGTDNTYDHLDIWERIVKAYNKTWEYSNMSLHTGQEIAENIRIAHPDQCVNLHTDDKCFIGNTTWNDQMKMFWEYETYSIVGTVLAKKRKAEAEAAGLIASWE